MISSFSLTLATANSPKVCLGSPIIVINDADKDEGPAGGGEKDNADEPAAALSDSVGQKYANRHTLSFSCTHVGLNA